MKYMAILKTTTIMGDSTPTIINWIRETQFHSHKKARKMADTFNQEQPSVWIYPNGKDNYPAQCVKWTIISEKEYNEIKGE